MNAITYLSIGVVVGALAEAILTIGVIEMSYFLIDVIIGATITLSTMKLFT